MARTLIRGGIVNILEASTLACLPINIKFVQQLLTNILLGERRIP